MAGVSVASPHPRGARYFLGQDLQSRGPAFPISGVQVFGCSGVRADKGGPSCRAADPEHPNTRTPEHPNTSIHPLTQLLRLVERDPRAVGGEDALLTERA